MIAACPKCSARYRIETGRLRAEGARLRCSRCEAVFRVRPPSSEADSAAGAEPTRAAREAPAAPQPAAAGVRAPQVGAPADDAVLAPPADRERLVVVADPEVEEGKATASALIKWGLQPILVHDGVEAILAIQRTVPRAAIIDAALPKMYGFQICELVKRNESLRHIYVVLIGAIFHRDRYRRPPGELYGADVYLERPQLPGALRAVLRGFGMPLLPAAAPAHTVPAPPASPATRPIAPIDAPSHSPPPAAVEPRAVPLPAQPAAVPPRPSQRQESAAAPALDESLEAQIEKAERLARIVVSDIVLYNQEKFEAAVQSDDVARAMDSELEEGRALFAQRIDARVREMRDFLVEELIRVASMRRKK